MNNVTYYSRLHKYGGVNEVLAGEYLIEFLNYILCPIQMWYGFCDKITHLTMSRRPGQKMLHVYGLR